MNSDELTCKDVLVEHDNIPNVKALYIGYDLGKYKLNHFSEVIMNTLVDFAFGYHTGILKTYSRTKLIDAAKSLYSIKDIKDYKINYIDQDLVLDDDNIKLEEKYFKRGEFGELILHCILRDYFGTVPLLSKMYFKDSDGVPVHGFDSVHIGVSLKNKDELSLFLGESKVYSRAKNNAGELGIKDLVQDIKEHFKVDFFLRECVLISRKKDTYISLDDYKDKNTEDDFKQFLDKKNQYMDDLNKVSLGRKNIGDFINSITVPLVCTYQSSLFTKFKDDSSEDFKIAYEEEITRLNENLKKELGKLAFSEGEIDKKKLNILLILLPIPSKKELLTTLHHKLWNQQNA